jgi:hypothetical protein
METPTTPNPEYIKGFNEGFIISKHLPDLAMQLSTATGDSERLQGMHDGRKQYLIDQVKSLRPSWLRDDVPNEINTEIDNSRDKDIEPEPDI